MQMNSERISSLEAHSLCSPRRNWWLAWLHQRQRPDLGKCFLAWRVYIYIYVHRGAAEGCRWRRRHCLQLRWTSWVFHFILFRCLGQFPTLLQLSKRSYNRYLYEGWENDQLEKWYQLVVDTHCWAGAWFKSVGLCPRIGGMSFQLSKCLGTGAAHV